MNFPRMAAAAIAAWIASILIGYVVDTLLLADLFAEHAAVMREGSEIRGLLPVGFGGMLLGFFVFSYAYAKGYEGSSGMQEGLRFGVIVGLMLVCFGLVWQYVSFRVSNGFLLAWIVGYIAEFAVYGAIVGLVYRPRQTRAGF